MLLCKHMASCLVLIYVVCVYRYIFVLFLNQLNRYYCTSPDIDTNSQTAIGCRSNGTVLVTCYTAPNVTCGNDTGYYTVDDIAFCKEESCRYV